MTIMAYRDGVMAADVLLTTGSMQSSCAFPKVIKLPDGGLLGCAGKAADCWSVQQWFLHGQPENTPPRLVAAVDSDDAVDFLWVKPDGSVWRSGGHGVWSIFPCPPFMAIGYRDACIVVDTCFYLGMSAVAAIETAIALHCLLGGPVQAEKLG